MPRLKPSHQASIRAWPLCAVRIPHSYRAESRSQKFQLAGHLAQPSKILIASHIRNIEQQPFQIRESRLTRFRLQPSRQKIKHLPLLRQRQRFNGSFDFNHCAHAWKLPEVLQGVNSLPRASGRCVLFSFLLPYPFSVTPFSDPVFANRLHQPGVIQKWNKRSVKPKAVGLAGA